MSRLLEISDRSHLAGVRNLVKKTAADLDFNLIQSENLAIIATELGTNILKHALTGNMLIHTLKSRDSAAIELIALDKGPGIANPAKAMEDGYSTAGSLGAGLGSVRRLSHIFDLYSQPGRGTVVLSRVYQSGVKPERQLRFEKGANCLPISDDEPCGDGWMVRELEDRLMILVVDGLGHGVFAAEAARQARSLFLKYLTYSGNEIVERIHQGLRTTRGAALAVAEIDPKNQVIHYTGIGNIAARIYESACYRNLVSLNGIAGAEIRKIQTFSYPWPKNALLTLHSDGLATRWDFNEYPGITSRHAAVIAAVLLRDFRRVRDDCTVVTIKNCEDTHEHCYSQSQNKI